MSQDAKKKEAKVSDTLVHEFNSEPVLEPVKTEVVIEEEKIEPIPEEAVSETEEEYAQRRMDWNGDGFLLIAEDEGEDDNTKGLLPSEYWNLSTRAMQISGAGCVVKTSTIVNGNVSEALVFIPGVKIHEIIVDDVVISRQIITF